MGIKIENLSEIEQTPMTLDAIWSAEWSEFQFAPGAWAKQTFEPAFTVPGGAAVSLVSKLVALLEER